MSPHFQAPEPLLRMSQLCDSLAEVFGQPVTKTRVNARIKMGMPYHLERGTGVKLFRLSEVLSWWIVPPGEQSA